MQFTGGTGYVAGETITNDVTVQCSTGGGDGSNSM